VGQILMEEFNNQEILKQKENQSIAREEAETEVERLKLEKQLRSKTERIRRQKLQDERAEKESQ
jgi:hypothetical protein